MKVKCISSFYVLNKRVFNYGEIVEFDKDLAEKLIKQGVVVEYIEKHIEEKEVNYDELTVKELKDLLKAKNLSTKGKKDELIQRLIEN